MNIFNQTKPVEINLSADNLHNYRYIGEEMEALGTRLDAARRALSQARSTWAQWYWSETLNRLMLQWHHLVALHDGDARVTQIPRWTADYEWWEKSQELQYTGLEGLTDQVFDKIFRSGSDLEAVWNRCRDERIMKCNCQ